MKKLLAVFLSLLLGGVGSFSCLAFVPYDSYTYSTQTGEAVAQFCPTPYYPAFTIDKATIGVPLVTPTCMCFDKEGNLYITDSSANRLLVLDKEYKLKASIDTLEDEEGNFEFLGGPEGIFVTDDGSIYLCDTKQKRILVLDQNYKLVRKYEGIRPLGENQEEDYMFLPTRIVVDASGNMYVLVQNEYQGIMQIDSDGRFISFVGGNKVTYDPVTKLWKKIMSKEQRAQLEQFLPVEYTNLSQDGEGLIYTVSKADNSDPIKRLNLSGKDVLIRNGYTDVIGDVLPAGTDEKTTGSLFVDIASDASGLIYALDANRGRIFVYNNEGFLFYVFGGIGTQLGTFATPSAIEVNGTDVLVADQGNPRITVFRRTAYAQMISDADEAYNTGRYDESVNIWNEVIKQNSNFELAYTQIGKVYLRRGQYKQAMDYFELGNFRGDKITNTTGYNKAFSEFRRETAAKWLGPAVITVVALAAGWWGWRFWRRKKKGTNRGEKA